MIIGEKEMKTKEMKALRSVMGLTEENQFAKHMEQPAFNLALMKLLVAKGVLKPEDARALHGESEETAQHLANFTKLSIELALHTQYEEVSPLTEEKAEQHVSHVINEATWLIEQYHDVLAADFRTELDSMIKQAKEAEDE